VTESQQSGPPGNPGHPHGQKPRPIADLQKLREALLAFLNDRNADWAALSRDLAALAAAPTPRVVKTLRPATPAQSSQEPVDPDAAKEAWRQLADFLAHADRAHGVPPQVQRLLESDSAARAAEAAFGEAMTQRQAWIDFSKHIGRTRPKTGH